GGTVEDHLVEAILTFDDVVAIAGIPDEGVVAGAHESHVVAATAVDGIIAGAAHDEIVTIATVDGELDTIGFQRLSVDDVISALTVDDQLVVGLLLEEDVHRSLQPGNADAAGVAADVDRIGILSTVDCDRIDGAIAAAARPA